MLPLPMTPAECLAGVLEPTFHELLPCKFDSPEARVLLLAIAGQESNLAYRKQVGGPAMGLFQFEQGGGVRGVLNHPASRLYARAVCLHRAVAPTERDLYMALSHDDMLAAAMARLLLWTDADPLPAIGQQDAAWRYYERNWRPGKPHPDAWGKHYRDAVKAVEA